ncbi:DUF4386 domain-containing protein [Hymenobacter pini]|uniref:DUF4386 domain-containing protein n=1 Tax=Hymenobacter pini TaxID=2880879 RepID=UPI001CF28072|nr:DUF4386 domain-containing protein [Hymenobacter pini]MCA8830709.1 DUF4386 domain-containing protein [Hymenobacter pini]
MITRSIYASPRVYARLGGALYLLIILFGAFAEGFVTDKLVVPGNAAATAQHILAAPGLWQSSVLGNLLVVVSAVPLMWIEYILLRPVSKPVALLALLLNTTSLAVEAVSKVFLLLVLPTLTTPEYGQALGAQGPAVLASLALKSHDVAFNIALIFFGATCLLNGYLIFRSGFLPKLLGVLLQLAGGCYLVACFAALFAPALAKQLLPGILLPCLIGETALCLWLLAKGVNRAQWQSCARHAQQPTLVPA